MGLLGSWGTEKGKSFEMEINISIKKRIREKLGEAEEEGDPVGGPAAPIIMDP